MNLPSAIRDYANMMLLGAEALERLVRRDASIEANAQLDDALEDVRAVAQRLQIISDAMRQQTPAPGP